MNNAYQNLPHGLLVPGTSLPQFQLTAAEPVGFDDPATSVFTDFGRTRAFATSPASTIAQINAAMIACGVRLLFVAENDGKLEGLVTYTDLYGEKPVSYLREHGGSREEILARDIMTPLARLETLALDVLV